VTRTIAFLVYDLRASGVVRNAVRIAAAARDAGLDARLWPIRLQGDFASSLPDGLPVEPVLPGITRRQRDIDSLLAVPALAGAIAERRPAILFSSGNQMHLHAALAMRRTRGSERPRFVGRASNAVISAGHAVWRRALWPAERFQYRAMDRIVAVSEELAGDLSRSLDLAPASVTVIPNGVDLERIAGLAREPVEHPFFANDGVPVILGVGRLSRQKNFEALLRGFARARSQRPLRLVILGPGGETRRARLRRLAADLGIGEAVAIEGYCANPFPYMRRAGLLALTSRWEGASNVLLEAMACGCPVVAVKVPTGVAEVLENGAIGPLVAPGDDAALAAAMLDRLARPRASDSLVARAGRYGLRTTLDAYVAFLTGELDVFFRDRSRT